MDRWIPNLPFSIFYLPSSILNPPSSIQAFTLSWAAVLVVSIVLLTTHLVVDESTTKDEVSQIKRELKSLTENMGLEHIAVEIEYGERDCSMKVDTRHEL